MDEASITGGCYCGEIRYRVDGELGYRVLCHCANCRRAVGAHSVPWLSVEETGFAVTSGRPTRYRTETDAWRTFCGTCGTSLTYQSADQAEEGRLDVTIGSLDHPERFAPTDPAWEEERLEWAPLVGVGTDACG